MPITTTAMAAAGSTARATPKSASIMRSDWMPPVKLDDDTARGPAVLNEEVLEVPEALT